MSTPTLACYAYARGTPIGNGSALIARLRAWCEAKGLGMVVSSSVSGPGYVVILSGSMPEPEHRGLGSSRYWYPEGATLEACPERAR